MTEPQRASTLTPDQAATIQRVCVNAVMCGACARIYHECRACGACLTDIDGKGKQCRGHVAEPHAADCALCACLAEARKGQQVRDLIGPSIDMLAAFLSLHPEGDAAAAINAAFKDVLALLHPASGERGEQP